MNKPIHMISVFQPELICLDDVTSYFECRVYTDRNGEKRYNVVQSDRFDPQVVGASALNKEKVQEKVMTLLGNLFPNEE